MENTSTGVHQLLNHLFRHESGKMVAVLSRLLGLQQMDAAQDLVQDTLLAAMNVWPRKGVPDNPSGWLMQVAKNRAVDYLRRQQRLNALQPQYAHLLQSEYTLSLTMNQVFLEHEIQDSQLRMIFACCHPAIAEESQVALTLKTLCGLSTAEIARAFLTGEDTIAKRIYRAKEKIKTEDIQMEAPSGAQLPARLQTVLQSLYLLFNEGYNSSHPERLIREDLCQEAMRLCYLLAQHPLTSQSSVYALLGLMCFQASRLQARVDDKGHIILLKYQDRTQWYQPLINKGIEMMQLAERKTNAATGDAAMHLQYYLEASIASRHAMAASFETTDWPSIYRLYDVLVRVSPGPVVSMNKAIAAAYALSPQKGLEELQAVEGLQQQHLYHASLGEMYFETGNRLKAKHHFEEALRLTASLAERQLLQEKIKGC
jgi:RNA polymerase sigma factor (sigma-70 family)